MCHVLQGSSDSTCISVTNNMKENESWQEILHNVMSYGLHPIFLLGCPWLKGMVSWLPVSLTWIGAPIVHFFRLLTLKRDLGLSLWLKEEPYSNHKWVSHRNDKSLQNDAMPLGLHPSTRKRVIVNMVSLQWQCSQLTEATGSERFPSCVCGLQGLNLSLCVMQLR